jgi:hypothetical protein
MARRLRRRQASIPAVLAGHRRFARLPAAMLEFATVRVRAAIAHLAP